MFFIVLIFVNEHFLDFDKLLLYRSVGSRPRDKRGVCVCVWGGGGGRFVLLVPPAFLSFVVLYFFYPK